MSKKSNNPLVSIITAAYNRENFLPKAVESVLSQTYEDWELLIMDDHSSDKTRDIAAKYAQENKRIRHIRNDTNLGIAKNRNKGLTKARGEYVAVLDADDFWLDDTKLTRQVSFLDENSNYVLVGTDVQQIDENDERTGKYTFQKNDQDIRHHILLRNQFIHSTTLFRKKPALACNGYDEDLEVAEDYKLWLCLGTRGKFKNLDMKSTAYRVHSAGATVDKQKLMAQTHDELIDQFKADYPNYWQAKIKSLLRLYIKPILP